MIKATNSSDQSIVITGPDFFIFFGWGPHQVDGPTATRHVSLPDSPNKSGFAADRQTRCRRRSSRSIDHTRPSLRP